MKIVVLGNEAAFKELSSYQNKIDWVWLQTADEIFDNAEADAFFILDENINHEIYTEIKSPVFINSVVEPISKNKNFFRINGWKGFLEKETWEIAGSISEKAEIVLNTLNKKFIITADEPGFISARIIAMIINEAYFAKGDGVSTASEIDVAMKLGTNYPLGPFEWGEKIGLENIYKLLVKLAEADKKYTPAPLLAQIIKAP